MVLAASPQPVLNRGVQTVAVEESTPAIVLRTRDYAEADRIVTLLTRDFGKLSGIAKGAKLSRRRFERKLEPFTNTNLYFRRRPHGQLVFITRAEHADGPPPPLDDLRKLALGSYMLELADALTTEEAEAGGAYQVLLQALSALEHYPASVALRQGFELKMLAVSGYGLDFAHCRGCGSPVPPEGPAVYFVVSRGGVVCTRCRPQSPETAVRLNPASAAAMARHAAAPLGSAPRLADGEAEGTLAITRFLTTILDRKLRSLDFLNSML